MSDSLITRGYVGGVVELVSPTGQIISISGNPRRWTPISARVRITAGLLFIMFEAQDNRFFVYDSSRSEDERWSAFFAQRSSIAADGLDQIITILPNGGWWREDFTLRFIAGTELTL